jgi:ATP-dependent exoDNAse (exonuclease V) beta subunit
VSAESLLLQNQPAIRLLIAAIEYLVHPDEIFYQVKLNYQYAAYLQQPHAEQFLTKGENGSYFFEEKIPALHRNKVSSLSTVAINELVFLLLQFLSLDQQTDNYLLRFQDVVFNYVQQYSTSPREFLTYWEEQKESVSIIPPEGIDAVKIYTIHKSKGLQFPVVIVPYAAWKMTPKPDTMVWVKSDEAPFQHLNVFPVEMTKKVEQSLFREAYLQEVEMNYIDNVNLLYVAFTRAEEQLYILSEAEKSAKNEAIPQSVSKLLYAILPDLQLKDSVAENNRFEYGKIVQVKGKEEDAIPLLPLQPVLLHNFRKEIALAKPKTYNEAQEKGNILHEILSKIKQPEQLYKAVATTTTEEVHWYTQAAKNVIALFQQQGWFDLKWQHLNERNMVYKGELLRADRILLSEDTCVIVDYKTGVKEQTHQQQLKKYKVAYSALLQRPVNAYLLYTDTLEIQEVN